MGFFSELGLLGAGLRENIAFRRNFRPDHSLLDPLQQQQLERDSATISRTSRTIERLDMELDRRAQEFRGSVSSRDLQLEQLESFRDRLIESNVRKQSEIEIVRRNIERTQRVLREHWKSAERLMPNPRVKKYFSNDNTSVVDHRRRFTDNTPRTVFGTDAWIARFVGRRVGHAMHLNGGFITKRLVIPCIQRAVRKEVMFAKGKAGHGHRGQRRRSVHGDVWC